jgi:hypothetical protein
LVTCPLAHAVFSVHSVSVVLDAKRAQQVPEDVLRGTNEVTQRLLLRARDADRVQPVDHQQPQQSLAVALIGLHPVAGGPLDLAACRVTHSTPNRLRWRVEQTVQDLNRFLRGWAGYFRYGNSTVQFDQINRHADRRLALLIAKRHQRPWRYGRQILNARPDRYGLISLNGTIVAPRPNRAWRSGR